MAAIAISDRMEIHDHVSANHNTTIQHNSAFKNWEDKGKSMMRVLYILWLANMHVLGQSNVE